MNGTIWQQADIAHGDNTPVKILFLQLVCTCAAYFFATFACKFNIQLESFALPIILVGPLTLSGVFTVCHYRQTDPCSFSPSIPDYIFYKVKNYPHVKYFTFTQRVAGWIESRIIQCLVLKFSCYLCILNFK